MSEETSSNQSASRPLTAAERQDLYRSSIGNILNTYTQSGLPYGGTGSMTPNATNATFNPAAKPVPATTSAPVATSGFAVAPTGGLYNANGNASTYSKGGDVTWDPKTYFQAPDPSVNMPTGAPDPGGINLPVYQTPQYQSPGAAHQLADGDYQALQKQMTEGYAAPIDRAKALDLKAIDQSMADRGIYTSLNALRANNDVNERYIPQYAQSGANATNAATGFQLAQNQNVNAYNTQNAQNANQFNVTNANNAFQAGWQPLQFLQGTWNGTGGQTTGSSSFGQGFSI